MRSCCTNTAQTSYILHHRGGEEKKKKLQRLKIFSFNVLFTAQAPEKPTQREAIPVPSPGDYTGTAPVPQR